MLNVVIINGGRGAGAIIPALLNQKSINLTSVVNAYDDGKSTGEIRRFFGMLGPSDIRKVQELMLRTDDLDYAMSKQLFTYRFPENISHQEAMAILQPFALGEQPELLGKTFYNQRLNNSIRACLLEFIQALKSIELMRNEKFDFSDCAIMNCIYAGAFLLFDRNIEKATLFLDRLFKLKGTVLPTNIEDKKLLALRENGEILYTEAEIVELRSNVRIERIYLLDQLLDKTRFEHLSLQEKRYYLDRHHSFVAVSPAVRLALKQADIIIYSAGTQHSSLYPTYLSNGLAQEIADNHQALKVLVTNIGADYETPSYKASDYILGAYRYLNMSDDRKYHITELMDVALVNQPQKVNGYDSYVVCDAENFSQLNIRVICEQFEASDKPGRHDGEKLSAYILSLYDEKQNQVNLS
jgi:2-phospho-L-lactate transferase/gluconeogenesis factor (CofD/UPF0052 family)